MENCAYLRKNPGYAPDCKICFKSLSICSRETKYETFRRNVFLYLHVLSCIVTPGPAVIRTVCKQ